MRDSDVLSAEELRKLALGLSSEIMGVLERRAAVDAAACLSSTQSYLIAIVAVGVANQRIRQEARDTLSRADFEAVIEGIRNCWMIVTPRGGS